MADEEAKQKEALNAQLKEYIAEWRKTRERRKMSSRSSKRSRPRGIQSFDASSTWKAGFFPCNSNINCCDRTDSYYLIFWYRSNDSYGCRFKIKPKISFSSQQKVLFEAITSTSFPTVSMIVGL